MSSTRSSVIGWSSGMVAIQRYVSAAALACRCDRVAKSSAFLPISSAASSSRSVKSAPSIRDVPATSIFSWSFCLFSTQSR